MPKPSSGEALAFIVLDVIHIAAITVAANTKTMPGHGPPPIIQPAVKISPTMTTTATGA
jgi:hypothetical protein